MACDAHRLEKILDFDILKHSSAHVMAAAVCKLYDNVQLDIGPATEDGFYYDFDMSDRISQEDFPRIEEEMKAIIAADYPFEKIVVSREDAQKMFEKNGQFYKLQRLDDIPADEDVCLYKCGDFVDLCRGPHIDSTGQIKSFKLTTVAGSYFRGIETNPMLQRIYGLSAQTPKLLKVRLKQLEEAAKRDHRKLGKELDLFSIQEDVGPGLVHWHPKGARIRSVIEDFWKQEHFRSGYELLYTPHIGRGNLWETSGHLQFYAENMYSPMDVDGSKYYAKPMNCPFHIEIYKSSNRSYRELPLRWAELGTVYRYEKSGVLHGLLRVRGFTQDDAHIFCTPEQIVDEVKETLRFSLRMLGAFGFKDIAAYLSTKPEKSVGENEQWNQAIESVRLALEAEGIKYEVDEGGGAFYGPKIDLKIKDAIGRAWQLGTIQFDFNLPERFNLSYIGEDGQKHRPYMVHRALLGSLERFFGILIEHYAGAFPLWLAPEQVRVLPITEDQLEYAKGIATKLREMDVRVNVDVRSDKIGAKIRKARLDKTCYMLVVGQREQDNGQVAVRKRGENSNGEVMALDEFIALFEKENKPEY